MSDDACTEDWLGSDGPTSTSTSLVERVKTQDPEAWRRLVKLYGPVVYRWCRRAGLGADDAADVCQDVFLAVAANMTNFRRDRPRDSFRGWLWTICRSKIMDHFRHGQREAQAEGGTDAQQQLAQIPDSPPDLSSATDSFGGDEHELELRSLELLRSEFEDRTWQAFWRMAIDGHAAAEIAEDWGMTRKAVRQAKYRVLRRLRLELDGLVE